jgi:RimJ/RimL family protein N-acetyltransferase
MAMNQNKQVMQYFPALLTATQTLEMIDRIKTQLSVHQYGLFAVEEKETHQFMGFTGFAHPKFESFFTPCVEIGWRFHPDYWKRGFATEAAKACLQFGWDHLKFQEIYSFTSLHNTPSENVMKRSGMQYISTFEHPLITEGHYLKTHVLYHSKP